MKKILLLLLLPLSLWGQTAKTDDALVTQALTIKNETVPAANTPLRIGTMFLDIIASKVNNANYPGIILSGTNTYTGTVTPALASYPSFYSAKVKFTNANTGSSSVNLSGPTPLGAKTLKKNVSGVLINLDAGDIPAGYETWILYDGTNFQINIPGAGGGGGGGTWGTITGTLSDQTDLQSALDAKISTTLNAGRIIVGNGSNAATGVAMSGDGTMSSAGALSVTKILGNTVPANATGVLSNNGSGTLTWAAGLTTTLNSAHLFVGNGSNVATDVAVSGDVTLSNAGAVSVTKILGNTIPSNGTGSLTNNGSGTLTWAPRISTTLTDSHILVGNASNVASDVAMTGVITITNSGVTQVASPFVISQGGHGRSTISTGGLLYGNGSSTMGDLSIGSTGQVLTVSGGLPAWASAASTNPGQNFTPTAVKTSNYTAAVGEFVPTDATAANDTITLPSAPADKSTIGVKMVTTGAGNITVVKTGGSDVFNVTGGNTSISLVRSKQSKIFQYKSSGAIWYVTGGDEALTSDPLYAANNFTDVASAGAALQNLGGASSLWNFNTQTGDYTFVITDAPTVDGKYTMVRMDKVTGQTLTVPPNASVAFPVGTTLYAVPINTGMTTVAAGAGVTINSSTGGLVTKKTRQLFALVKTATNTWDLNIGTPPDITLPTSATVGDILRATSANTYTNLALGTALQTLRVNAGATDIEWFTNTNTGWALTGTSTLTGSTTITSNTASWHNFTGSWTASANNQWHMNFTGTLTARATASDLLRYAYWNPTMISGAATQTLAAFTIDPTFTPTGGASTNYILRLMNAGTDKYTINDAGLANYVDAGGTTRLQMTTVSARISFNNNTSHYIGNTGVAGTSATSTTHGLIFNALGTIVAGGAGGMFNFASGGFSTGATGTHRILAISPSNVISYGNTGAQTANYIGIDLSPGINFANAGGTFTVTGLDYNPADAAAIAYTHYGILSRPTGAKNGFGTATPTSTLSVTGSVSYSYVAKTANYTITGTDYLIDCTSNSFTVTLPTAVGITGRIYIVKNSGTATTITMATTSSQTIDGSAPGTIAATLVPMRLMSNGANWITW